MASNIRGFGFAICVASALCAGPARAGTILFLNPSGTPDIGFDGINLATLPGPDGATTGDQNTTIDFQDFLSSRPDVGTPTASLTLSGVAAAGAPQVFGSLVVQTFSGGTLDLYDPANALMLAGALDMSALTGTLGPPGTASVFTTTFANVTGGSLMPLLAAGTLTISISMSSVNGGNGLSVQNQALAAFSADSVITIAADAPEPPVLGLMFVAAAVLIRVRSSRSVRLAVSASSPRHPLW